MKDIYLSELTAETYKALQIHICQQALLGSRDPGRASSWKNGDAPASSARKRLYLLYSFLLFLKNEEGLSFPVRPTRYNCTTPRQEQLLERTDYVRSLPDEPLRRACATSQFLNLAGVLLDAGLRISEAAGLLFSSLRTIWPRRTKARNLWRLPMLLAVLIAPGSIPKAAKIPIPSTGI